MTKKLSKKELFKLIKEVVTKKVNLLREDIALDDDEIWDYYDDNLYNDWQNNYGQMPKGYDDDVTDLDTLDRMGRMNSDLNGSPALKRAQIKASWAASDREDRDNADKLYNQYQDNYYNDFNINSDPYSSEGSGITDPPGVSASSDKMWDRSLNTNENRVYKSIKKMMEVKIRKNPSAFGLRENKINMKEEVDMGQISAVSDRRSTAKEYSPEVKKEIRKLRNMIDDYEREGKDTSELTKRIQKLKNEIGNTSKEFMKEEVEYVHENKKFDAKEFYVEMTWFNGGEATPEEIKAIIDYCLSIGYKKVPSDEDYYQVKLVLNNSKDDTLYFQLKPDPWNDGCAWHWDYRSWRWSE